MKWGSQNQSCLTECTYWMKTFHKLFFFQSWKQDEKHSDNSLEHNHKMLASMDFGTITRWGPAISLKCFMYPSKEMVCKVQDPVTIKKWGNAFKACWWISPRAYFVFFIKKKGKMLSITGCPTKFLKGTHDTHKKEGC